VTLLQVPSGSGVPKLTAGTRYLEEQLSTHGAIVLLSEGCLKDFVLNAMEVVVRNQQQRESYISCLCRHLDARARFTLLWTGTDETYDRAVWGDLVVKAQKHTLPRACSGVRKASGV
jgi:hypothetical protein